MSRRSFDPPRDPSPDDIELGRLLRAADPASDEPPMAPSEEAALRRALEHAGDPPVTWFPRRAALAALAGAAILVLAVLNSNRIGPPSSPAPEGAPTAAPTGEAPSRTVLALTPLRQRRLAAPVPLAPPPPLRPQRGSSADAVPAARHQIHLTATNGTRIIWTVSAAESPPDPGSRKNRS